MPLRVISQGKNLQAYDTHRQAYYNLVKKAAGDQVISQCPFTDRRCVPSRDVVVSVVTVNSVHPPFSELGQQV